MNDEPRGGATGGARPRPAYWRSLEQLRNAPEYRIFADAEFAYPAEPEAGDDGASRRAFLKLMGASVAFAGSVACRWPEERIMPFAHRPAGRTPGETELFATAMEIGGVATGLLAESVDGRPIKIEGNPDHPASLGACGVHAQASVLDLYAPDRSKTPSERVGGEHVNRSWEQLLRFVDEHFATLRGGGGAGLAVLAEASSSATRADMRERFIRAFPQARWFEYEPLARETERAGTAIAFGSPHRTQLHPGRADVLVSLDADILEDHPDHLRNARGFASRRVPDQNDRMSRLYVLESVYSITGGMADHRAALPTAAITGAAGWLARALAERGVLEPGALPRELENAAAPGPALAELIEAMAEDLAGNRGRGLVVAGPRQPAAVHALVALLNARLDNAGATVTYTAEPDPDRPPHAEAIAELGRTMQAGAVQTLVVLGGNPVYDAPADVEFAAALDGVPVSLHLSETRNETSRACRWHAPRAHWLEAWGDARAWDGAHSVVQPLIRPLYEGRTAEELLALMIDEGPYGAYDLVRRALDLDEEGWLRALRDGVIENSAWSASAPAVRSAAVREALAANAPAAPGDLELVLLPDISVHDGRFAGNAWLRELPDPLTKLVWDNALLVNPATAARLGLAQGQMARIDAGPRSLEAAVYVMPGQAEGVLALPLGYGREALESPESAVRGFDGYRLRTTGAMTVVPDVTVQPLPARYELVTTQDHFAIDDIGQWGKDVRLPQLVREATLSEYVADPEHVSGHRHKLFSLWEEHSWETGYRWGMAVDLGTCIGCAACVIACQAENNVPVVGKDQVKRGREMHWLRVDRYFRGDLDNPQVVMQPVPCQHCEDAPCEQVCPVAATVHDSDGLNVMVYNRCVGTRYCSNNCPYKVRRFNFFNFRKGVDPLEAMAYNPEVTVRSRGVMEKCTFCVQRIWSGKIEAKAEGRRVRDGEVIPACAQTCPTEAIVFGDLNDPESRVRKLQDGVRAYPMLEELNVKPRVEYLVRLRNPVGGAEGAAAHTAAEEHS
jgi:molybdopterin-containing oxidoreductase family iron-sulfur binding subunit